MIAAVVLAAGTGTRFGGERPKQLAELAGRPLAQHAVDAAAAAGVDEILVVTGHEAGEVERALRLPPNGRFVTNRSYETGMASSIRAGLAAAGDDVEAVVVLLADQPGVTAGAVRAVVAAFRRTGKPIVVTRYRDASAPPVLFARAAWRFVDELEGDVGAREVVAAHPELVATLDAGSAVPADVDTPEDLDRLRPDM